VTPLARTDDVEGPSGDSGLAVHSQNDKDSEQRYRIGVLEKAVAVLRSFSPDRTELTIREIVEHTGQTRAGVYRIVVNLVRLGLLERDTDGIHYRVGSGLFAIGSLAVQDLRRVAMRHMSLIQEAAGYTVNLAIRQERESVLIEILEGRGAFRMASSVGSREPLYCTAAGKCLLAFEPLRTRETLMQSLTLHPHTPATITSLPQLVRVLDEVRAQTFATDPGEFELHGRCVAVPVFDHHGRVTAAVSVSGPDELLEDSQLNEIKELLRQAGRNISRELGAGDEYPPPAVARSELTHSRNRQSP
jgi:DNA-binding IclR family transcriptional regulator